MTGVSPTGSSEPCLSCDSTWSSREGKPSATRSLAAADDVASRISWRRYAALGDSFTEGMCDDFREDGRYLGWADRVAQRLADLRGDGIEYANLAVRGRLIEQVVTEQVPHAVRLKPDLTTLAVGVNDTLRRRFDLDRAATMLESGVRQLRECGSDVVIFAFGNPARRSRVLGLIADRIKAYDTAVESIAREYGCMVVHYWDVAAMDDDSLWADDRLHLSAAGHVLAAASVLEAIGAGDDSWRTPIVGQPTPGVAAARLADLRWVGRHAGPWLARRARGRSSGAGVEPKNPDWTWVAAGQS